MNFDEINLNNANITKIVEPDVIPTSSSYDSCFENNPIYDEIPCSPRFNNSYSPIEDSLEIINQTDFIEEVENKLELPIKEPEKRPITPVPSIEDVCFENTPRKNLLKTSVQVHPDEKRYSPVRKNEPDNHDEFKTVVSVEEPQKESSPKEKRHSHNYLREFLESQKGSRKPLQNFLSKKISRAFGESKKNVDDCTLANNQFHSLPDLSVSKNLRHCEKIDRKLRKCEKLENSVKVPTSNNRFIVNIGRHFDVTAESNIPVDFEVKISKIPKLRKSKSSSKSSKHSEGKQQVFIEAVKNLNETLSDIDENHNIVRPQVVEVTAKNEGKIKFANVKRLGVTKYKKPKEPTRAETKSDKAKIKPLPKINEVAEDPSQMDPEANKEFQEKLGTMRNYWGKLTKNSNDSNIHEDDEDEEESPKCKIVDVQTKVEDVIRKFETKEEKDVEKQERIVYATKQIFEPKCNQEKSDKLSPFVKESCEFFENPYFDKNRTNGNQFESLNPNIVEIIEKSDDETKDINSNETIKKTIGHQLNHTNNNHYNNNNNNKPLIRTKSSTLEGDFDHVRYRVMKSDLFQKNIFANCQKESQFDGLMQYLKHYSFQELLIDNNIVIIEPIRTNVAHEGSHSAKSSRNITNMLHKSSQSNNNSTQELEQRRRFFYHPIRVNREMNEDELPNPDTVRMVRQLFERGLKKSQSSQDLDKLARKTVQYQTIDPDKDNCSATDSNSNPSNISEMGSNDNIYDNELCCELQYVSEDVLQKIRECGTSVTYYGGKVLNKKNGGLLNPMTRVIMEEIKGNQVRECTCKKSSQSSSRKSSYCSDNDSNKDSYQGIKFKLLKSNSCSSRLELVGTENVSEYKHKFFEKQKYLIDEKNRENQRKNSWFNENDEEFVETQTIQLSLSEEESIKQNEEPNTPKIIATTGKKMIQWGTANDEKTYSSITYSKPVPKPANYDYNHYEELKMRTKKIDDMEFETYEIAGT